MRSILGVATAVVLIGSLTACGGSGSEGSRDPGDDPVTSASPTVKQERQSAACDLLTAEEREELAGTPVDTVVAVDSAAGTYQCRWSTRADAAKRAVVQATSTPAHTWAEDLPAVMAQLEESAPQIAEQYGEDLDRIKTILESGKEVTDGEACKLFSAMAEVNGGEKDATRLVSYIEVSADMKAASAQTCTGGIFTSVFYGAPDLEQSASTRNAVLAALRRAHFKSQSR